MYDKRWYHKNQALLRFMLSNINTMYSYVLYSIHIVRLCDKKLICTSTNEFREKMTGEGGQIMSCQSTSRSTTVAISPLKAHLPKPRGAEGHDGRQESKLQTPKK